ncbi:hypothetical protein CDAR_95541 [Caerostris darwini]|uniref:Uncharacterized protein n=1 Tax=Caerostris darwini TaxID=1538125 RepID=A0AAV4M6J0_9ARAC|nr:hypothetical protein CDAR_95541 [Caerostris darwini]
MRKSIQFSLGRHSRDNSTEQRLRSLNPTTATFRQTAHIKEITSSTLPPPPRNSYRISPVNNPTQNLWRVWADIGKTFMPYYYTTYVCKRRRDV